MQDIDLNCTRNDKGRKHTSRSSCFLLNSTSVSEESQLTLYSFAISFSSLSLSCTGGAISESFSIICHGEIQRLKLLGSRTETLKLLPQHVSHKFLLTVRLTLVSGRSSETAEINSFPYFAVNKFLTCKRSGKSEHLGAANIMLAIASCNSEGHCLQYIYLTIITS